VDAGHHGPGIQGNGHKKGIWPMSSFREANNARAEPCATIGYHDYEALDQSIVTTIVPEAMPQR
jgi:hypothetical protein